MPDLLPREERTDLCREPECEAHGSGNAPCPVKAVERAVQDRLTPEQVEDVAHRGVSMTAVKSWEVYQSEDGESLHVERSCAVRRADDVPTRSDLIFVHDSAAGNELHLVSGGQGMPPQAVPDADHEPVGRDALCGRCAQDLKHSLPEDVNE